MAARIRGNNASMEPFLPDGTTINPLFAQLLYLRLRGYPFEPRDNGFAIRRIRDFKTIDIDRILSFVENGAKVLDYPVWIRRNETQFNTEDVPNYMPHWSVDDLGVTAKKWATWFTDGQEVSVTVIGGNNVYWIQTSGSDGQYVDGDIIKQLNDAGYNLKSQHQMQAIVAADPS